ncbi:MAG: methyltransferase domain-containing protein [archaeon]
MRQVKDNFDRGAKDYDADRKKVIPHLEIFYEVAASLAETESASPHILDIGAGTGLLTSYLIARYPHANITLIDFSEEMLNIAKSRFQDKSNIIYIVDDYSKHDFKESYDIIVSALSIHHLDDSKKLEFYKKCFSILNPGGIFINADITLGSSPFLESLYKSSWRSFIEKNIASIEQVQEYYERMKVDKEATVDAQLGWLKVAGFEDVDCMYKYYNFAVLFAQKCVR